MAARSLINHRGFFSDYWLGSLLSRRQADVPRPTPAQARRLLARLTRLTERVDRSEPLDLTLFREQFARPLLGDLFGWELLPREETDNPRLRLLGAIEEGESAATPLTLLCLCPENDRIESAESLRAMEKALLETGLDYGFLLSPAILRLVRAPGRGPRGAAFDLSMAQAVEMQDEESLQAAGMIFASASFQAGPDGRRPIETLEEESRRHKAKVSEDLKQAVFEAAELVVAGFLADLRERPDAVSPAPNLFALRDAGLLTLYRLLFILYAESRDDRLATHTLYRKSYSLDDLVGRLLHIPLEELPGNRIGLWERLQALFRIYNEGLPPLPGLQNIPPRGGRLFSDTTPEGRIICTLRLDDRSLGRLVLTLATARPRRGVGRERISFRELEIEQLGAVYEGLLEYEPAVARETLIHIAAQGREYALSPAELVRLCAEKNLHLKGDGELVRGTAAADLHPDFAEEEAAEEADEEADDENEDVEADVEEDKGLKKGAALRLLHRIEPGTFLFMPGAARKATGSYYTPTEIVDYLVAQACAGIRADTAPEDIERLRVIDLACGSAHFLVGAARHLGTRLFAAYRRQGGVPPPAFHPYRDLTPAVRDEWERLGPAWCKRRVVERCLFGVDINPTAVQLAQVALWIESLAGDRPLSFFDHHIRCGNSLLGTWSDRLHQPPLPDLDKKMEKFQGGLFEFNVQTEIQCALAARQLIEAPLPADIQPDTPDEYRFKQDRLEEAQKVLVRARLLFDLRSAAVFVPAIWRNWHSLLGAADLEAEARAQPWWAEFETIRARECFFHWELEFPEVFAGERKGFDIVLGNPPWEKVIPDRKEFYGRVDVLIRAYAGGELDARIRELHALHAELKREYEAYKFRINTMAQALKKGGDFPFNDWKIDGKSVGGHPDLFKFFIEQAHRILRIGGRLGFLVPSALYNNEGCTGLRHLLLDQCRVQGFYAFENRRKLFPIDSRYKFVLLATEKCGGLDESAEVEFNAAFMRHDVEELKAPPAEFQVLIRRSELRLLSPGTLAFLEYRDPRDREIVLKMYGLLPGQTPRPLLGDQGHNAWNARFSQQFNITTDNDLWTKPDGKLWTPKEVCGLDYPADRSIPFTEVRAAMATKGFWPLYEGKHIEQFLTEIRPISRWFNLAAAQKKYGETPTHEPLLVFRRIAGNTNERTCVSAVIPPCACASDGVPLLIAPEVDRSVACAILNSFVFDFCLRFRVMTHVDFTHIARVVAPGLKEINQISSVTTRSSEVVGGISAIAEYKPAYPELWAFNRSVAEAYGLTANDFKHILDTFPVFARKRPAFHAYLHERVAEWKAG